MEKKGGGEKWRLFFFPYKFWLLNLKMEDRFGLNRRGEVIQVTITTIRTRKYHLGLFQISSITDLFIVINNQFGLSI